MSKDKSETPALKQYRVTFTGDGGDILVGHNYKLNVYQRNVEVIIDENFLQVIKHAVVETDIREKDGTVRHIRIPQYQYSAELVE